MSLSISTLHHEKNNHLKKTLMMITLTILEKIQLNENRLLQRNIIYFIVILIHLFMFSVKLIIINGVL